VGAEAAVIWASVKETEAVDLVEHLTGRQESTYQGESWMLDSPEGV
jgi:hypothetical protein